MEESHFRPPAEAGVKPVIAGDSFVAGRDGGQLLSPVQAGAGPQGTSEGRCVNVSSTGQCPLFGDAQVFGKLSSVFGLDAERGVTFYCRQMLESCIEQHVLQLGFSCLQLLLISPRDGHVVRQVATAMKDCSFPMPSQRQRTCLPLPLPSVGAVLKMGELIKCPETGLAIYRNSALRHMGKQQRAKLVSASAMQVWRLLSVIVLNGEHGHWQVIAPAASHAETAAQAKCLQHLTQCCAWWTRAPLQVRPEVDFYTLSRSKQVDYSGDEVLKALPLRLGELMPGLPEDGVAGSLDASAIADDTVQRWLLDPTVTLLEPASWPDPLPAASMKVDREHWFEIVGLLFKKRILVPIDFEEIFKVRGKPVLNGVFAVEKKGTPLPGELRVTRLIMNLVPANSLQKLMAGDLGTLAGSAHWASIQLRKGEALLWSGDDQRGAFYAWSLPAAWRGLMTFKWPVPGRIVGRPDVDMIYVASGVIPMGWLNAVSLFQHLHRRAGLMSQPSGAGLVPSQEWRRDRPVPAGAVEGGGCWFQFYLDDFDCPEKVDMASWKTLANTMSQTHAQQRGAYKRIGIGISAEKAHVREPRVVRMGAEVDGLLGILSAPVAKMLEVGWLCVWLMSQGPVCPRVLMMVLGRLVRVFEFRRPLTGLLNDVWPKAIWGQKKSLRHAGIRELIRSVCLLGLAHVDLRTPVSGLVTCSDASELGGGVCATAGLTEAGEHLLARLKETGLEAGMFMPSGSYELPKHNGPRIFCVSLFDGVAALMVALARLECCVIGYAASEMDKRSKRLIRTRWPGVMELGPVQHITDRVVQHLVACIGYRIDFVLVGAALSNGRSGSLSDVVRIINLLKDAFAVPVHFMVEHDINMSGEQLVEFSRLLEVKPYLVDAKHFTWIRKPSLFWVSWFITARDGEKLVDHERLVEWCFPNHKICRKSWVEPDCSWDAHAEVLLPAFTGPWSGSSVTPRSANSVSASQGAFERWVKDSCKLPVCHYEAENLITCADGSLRLPTTREREVLMGFDIGYISEGLPLKLKGSERELVGCQMIGLSLCVYSCMLLAHELLTKFGGSVCRNRERLIAIGGVAPAAWMTHPVFSKAARDSTRVQALVEFYIRTAERGGSDVRLDLGVPFRAKAWPRSGVQANIFQWAIIQGFPWKHVAHINALELQSLINSVRWRLRSAKNYKQRVLLLIDSQVVCALVAKGRTSSLKLRSSLAVLNALVLASGLMLTVAYVDTGNNPSDIPSRWGEQRSLLGKLGPEKL